MRTISPILCLPLLISWSCTHTVIDSNLDSLYFIEVTVADANTVETPFPFSPLPVEKTISIRTLDGNGDAIAFTGDLKINVRPGTLATGQDPWIHVENGEIRPGDEVIAFQSAFGPTRIWVSDEGDKDQTSERKPTFATGVAEELFFAFPTIADFNKSTDDSGVQLIQNTTNHLVSEFTEVRLQDRRVVTTVVSPNGFWVTDIDDYNNSADGGFASLYVYSFSKPDGIVPGAILSKLTGGNQEYLGSTQLSFPDYEVSSVDTSLIPAPKVLTGEQACNTNNRNYDNHKMESFESALVTMSNATVAFNGDQSLIAEYLEYGQWPVTFTDGGTSCTMYVDSSALSYDFDPVAWDGQDVGPVTGIVNQIWSKWILVLADDNGISNSFADGAAQRPRSPGPRRPIPRYPTE